MKRSLKRTRVSRLLFSLCVAAAVSHAQTLTTLVNFNTTNGSAPIAPFIQGLDGNLYGTTGGGGTGTYCPPGGGCGTVFKKNPAGTTVTTIYSFCSQPNCADGADPNSTLVQSSDGNLYGTTIFGGNGSYVNPIGNGVAGTIFKITAGGSLTTLYSFCSQPGCTDGCSPNGVMLASNGRLYGTTNQCGANSYAGTAFEIDPAGGGLVTLYNFCSLPNCTDGATPYGALIQATDGNLYGTTWAGGNDGSGSGTGTVFKMTTGGKVTTLATVDGYPDSGVIQGSDGNFYGAAARSGAIFRVTPRGKVTTLATACCFLYGGVIQATDGNLYGTTAAGGSASSGSIFEVNPTTQTLTTLYSFCVEGGTCPDGSGPEASLVQATNGILYGNTVYGGTFYPCPGSLAPGCGTIFGLSVGLGPFVEPRPTFGKVGTKVTILKYRLKGATGVTFNGTPVSSFTVNSSGTAIFTSVPSGATTGVVVVTPSSGPPLESNAPFTVR